MTTRPATVLDAAALAVDVCGGAGLDLAHGIHRAVSRRAFAPCRSLRLGAAERLHDAVIDGSYGVGTRSVALGAEALRLLSAKGYGGPRLEDRAVGRRVLAAVNGVIGPRLEAAGDPQAITMAVRHGGSDVRLTSFDVGSAFSRATGHLAVFLHGFLGTEETWSASSSPDLPAILRDRTGATPVLVRYNTGLPPATNGASLDAMLSDLVEHWPTAPTRITFVGHGMGALVARAALNVAQTRHRSWLPLVRDVVFLGEPQLGSARDLVDSIAPLLDPPRLPQVAVGRVGPEVWEGRSVTSLWGRGRQAAAPLPWADHWYATTDPASRVLDDVRVAFLVADAIGAREAHPRSLPS